MKYFLRILFSLSFSCIFHTQSMQANSTAYLQRQINYADTALTHFNSHAMVLQAYRGIPVDSFELWYKLNSISTGATNDFDIVQLIRILYFSSGQYDARILPVLNREKYWLTGNEVQRNYWSENHMIMWMSSNWLMHERYGMTIDSSLHTRLKHYLELKVNYGFYEFFSSVYSPYCLSGLINLADFSADPEIKALAITASQRLLKDLILLSNDQGVFFPTAGRNYCGKYLSAYGQNHSSLIWLVSGMGAVPGEATHAGAFLASSTLEVDSVTNSWVSSIDTSYYNGHTLDSGLVINRDQRSVDKVIFQWSSGAYFHPTVALSSWQLLTDSSIWNHPDFSPFTIVQFVPASNVTNFADQQSSLSKSSVISGEYIHIFKHKSITLSSVQDFWKGKVGYQQFPCVANIGTTAVFTASGRVRADWDRRNPNNANEHLPYVAQKKNLALLMYRPEPVETIFGFVHSDVALYFKDSDYDEVREDSMWLIGRLRNNYVGVRRSCLETIDSVRACHTVNGQTWVIMVGDSDMYGSFDHFQAVIDSSHFTERWYYDSTTMQEIYYAKIEMDTITIEYAWGRDSLGVTGIPEVTNSEVSVYPNPFSDQVNVRLGNYADQKVHVRVYNLTGVSVYDEYRNVSSDGILSIPTRRWATAVYQLRIDTKDATLGKRLVKLE